VTYPGRSSIESDGLKLCRVECLELAVVTKGRTLEMLVASLNESAMLHPEGEDPALIGVVREPRNPLT